MSPHLENTGTHDYGIGLDAFIPAKELKAMFKRYFDDQEDKENCYHLEVNGADRVYAGLSAAVRIQENNSQIRFSFSWGREQSTAAQLNELNNSNPRRIPTGTEAFVRIVSLLNTIQPEVYRGGPDPELPFESQWHLDYQRVLKHAEAVADHIFFQNIVSTYDSQGKVNTDTDVVFMKIEVK